MVTWTGGNDTTALGVHQCEGRDRVRFEHDERNNESRTNYNLAQRDCYYRGQRGIPILRCRGHGTQEHC